MDIDEIKSKTSQELNDVLLDLRTEFINIVFENKTKRISNNSRFSLLKKDIARILTILNQRRGGVVSNV